MKYLLYFKREQTDKPNDGKSIAESISKSEEKMSSKQFTKKGGSQRASRAPGSVRCISQFQSRGFGRTEVISPMRDSCSYIASKLCKSRSYDTILCG